MGDGVLVTVAAVIIDKTCHEDLQWRTRAEIILGSMGLSIKGIKVDVLLKFQMGG